MFCCVLPKIVSCTCREMSTGWENIAITEPRVQHGDPIWAGAGKEWSSSPELFHKVELLGYEMVLKYGRPHGATRTTFLSLALPWEGWWTQQKWHHLTFRGWVIKGLEGSAVPWTQSLRSEVWVAPERGHLNVLRWQMLLSPGSQPPSPRCQPRAAWNISASISCVWNRRMAQLSCLNSWPTNYET